MSKAQLAPVRYRGRVYYVDARWLARRRIVRLVMVYVLLILLAVFMVFPLVYGFISSFSNDPLAWPPRIASPRLWPPHWLAAWKLGVQGGGNGWTGGWAPGRHLEFTVTFRYPRDDAVTTPSVKVLPPPAELKVPDPTPFTAVEVSESQRRTTSEGKIEVTYKLILDHHGTVTCPLLPIAVIGAPASEFVRADMPPDLVSARVSGTYLTWQNLAPGAIGYLFYHYIRLWMTFKGQEGKPMFPYWIRNSFFIALLKVVVTVVFSTMAGYALARLRFPGRNFLFFFTIFTMMIPGQVTMISNYLVVRDGVFGLSKLFGLKTFLNTFWALFLPGLVSTSAVFMMKQFMESIPRELEEAARIDGANSFQIYFRIILPLSYPAIAAVSILAFQGSWNEFFWPSVVLTQPEKYTLPLGINYLLHYYHAVTGSLWNMILAGTIISFLPVLLIYILFQRYFTEGFHLSGIKQ